MIRRNRFTKLVREAALWVYSAFPYLEVAIALVLGRILLGLRARPPAQESFDGSQIRKILVVRLDVIGDFAFNTPLLRELQRGFPSAKITVVVNERVLNLCETCPYVDEVIPFRCNVPGFLAPVILPWRAYRIARRRLSAKRFELAIVPRREAEMWFATFIAYFSGAKWRYGFSSKVSRFKARVNHGFDRLLTHVIPDDPVRKHEVEHNLAVLRALGVTPADDRTELWVTSADESCAEEIFRRHGIAAELPVFGICPSPGNSELKQWPISSYAKLCAELVQRYGCKIVILGGPGEEPLGRLIEDRFPANVINLIGKTTLRQMAAVQKRCDLFIGNDAGPLHVAAAMGVPVIGIYGSSCHHRFGPWKHQAVLNQELPCSPCGEGDLADRCWSCVFEVPRCLTELGVALVLSKTEKVQSERKLRPARNVITLGNRCLT
jgi:lipopolysaccharide heptosyltransferase II